MGANVKALRTRIKSVNSTMHMTKAMELVASSKLKRAAATMDCARRYAREMRVVFNRLMTTDTRRSPFVEPREEKAVCLVVVAGDRGLAGGYNNNVFRVADELASGKRIVAMPIGKRAVEYCQRRGYAIFSRDLEIAEFATPDACAKAAKKLCDEFAKAAFDRMTMVYTRYTSMLSQTTTNESLLPLGGETGHGDASAEPTGFIEFEPNAETVLNTLVPDYIASAIYGAVRESLVSELSARRTAMDSASRNASEMIEKLSVQYNRARQGAITQEITEIIAGSEAGS